MSNAEYTGMGYHIMVADMDKMFAYYRDVVGLEAVDESEAWSSFKVGDAVLGLHHGRESPVGEPIDTHFWLEAAPDRLQEQIQRLRERGANIIGEIDGMTVIEDPEGNRFTVS